MLLVPLAGVLVVRAWVPTPRVTAPVPTPSPPTSAAASAQEEPAEDRTPEIRGRILDADGNPVLGAAIRLVLPRPPFTVFREAKSDASGAFSFARVRAPAVRVVADHDPDGVVSSGELRTAEGQTREITLVLSAASAVRGTVVDGDGHPVAGAALSVEGIPWIVRTATSDEAGAFRLATVPEEAASLVAVARGYRSARVALSGRSGQDELVVRVRLTAAAPAYGDVRDEDGNPARARVVACEGEPSEARTTSADDGTFTLPPSAIGCNAVADHDEHAPSDAAAVVEGRRVALRLKPGGSIEGVVVDDRGAGVPSFTVGVESFSPLAGASGRPHAPRGARAARLRGRARLLPMGQAPPGQLRAHRRDPPGAPPARSDAIDVAGGVATKGVRIVLAPGGSVTGHVYDDRHAPLAGVDVRFDAVSSVLDSTADAKTDGAGAYRLDGAPAGVFTVRVQKDGFRVRMISGLRVDSRGTLAEDVTLTPFDGGAGVELGGIGAALQLGGDGIHFGAVYAGDPAERAGLRAGDRVVRIDGEDADGMSLADVLQRLRGQAGTTVGVSVERGGTGETLDFTVLRAAIVH